MTISIIIGKEPCDEKLYSSHMDLEEDVVTRAREDAGQREARFHSQS